MVLRTSLTWSKQRSSISFIQTVAVDDEEEVESEEVLETKKFSLIELFSQMFMKENLDENVNLRKYLVSASQTIPMSAILQVKTNRNYILLIRSRDSQ